MALITAFLLLFSQSAKAADCESSYTVDALLGDLVMVEEFLRNGDNDPAVKAGKTLETGLSCLGELLPAMIAGRSYRAVAAAYVAGGDTDRGSAWYRTATEIDQSFDYGLEDLPADHPIRDVYASAKADSGGEKVLVDGMGWALGANYLDGRKADKPAARQERPHIFQRDDSGVQTWLIEGNAFPAEVMSAAAAVAKAPEPKAGKDPKPPKAPKVKEPKAPKEPKVKEPKSGEPKVKEPKAPKKPKGATSGAVTVARQRPGEKTPLIIGGGVVIGGAGAIYALALSSKAKFEKAESIKDITDLQKATNQLVIVSAATLAVGAGTFTWGVILDGSTPVPAVQIRF